MVRFKIEKIVDEYYSDKIYATIIKLSLIDGGLKDNFKEGQIVDIKRMSKK